MWTRRWYHEISSGIWPLLVWQSTTLQKNTPTAGRARFSAAFVTFLRSVGNYKPDCTASHLRKSNFRCRCHEKVKSRKLTPGCRTECQICSAQRQWSGNKRGKAVPIHATRAYMGSGGVIPLIHNVSIRRASQPLALAALPPRKQHMMYVCTAL
jgi:hypothetical protein